MPVRIRRLPDLTLLPILLLLSLSLPALAGDPIVRDFSFEAESLLVADMIGSVTVVPAPGDRFTVKVSIGGQDADEGRLEFVTREGSESSLAVKFPTRQEEDYVYPPLGPGSKSTISYNEEQGEDGSWVKKVLGEIAGRRITVRGQGKGLQVWADLTIAVPRGASLTVDLGVGDVQATGLEADLTLDVDSGPVQAQDIQGDVLIDTGSGRVTAANLRGSLSIDTGSGEVEACDVQGDRISVDTGSGDVLVRDAKCEKVGVDTGSGEVEVEGVDCRDLVVDTGSGGVLVRGAGADKARIDTGSGRVRVDLDRMGDGKFSIDTGSGDIAVQIPRDASARIRAETSSGEVSYDLRDATVNLMDRNEMDLTVGGAGATVTLDAGSGSITVTQK